MTDARRRMGLFATLAVALGWSAWLAINDPADEADTIELARPDAGQRAPRTGPSVPPRAPAGMPDSAAAPRPPAPVGTPRLAQADVNLFPGQTWYVPPPPPPPPPYVPPPPPQAPALPYTYMGRWQENGETIWYLVRGSLPLPVRNGQVLDGVWRLDTARAGMLDFTYLPLNQTRSLRTGD